MQLVWIRLLKSKRHLVSCHLDNHNLLENSNRHVWHGTKLRRCRIVSEVGVMVNREWSHLRQFMRLGRCNSIIGAVPVRYKKVLYLCQYCQHMTEKKYIPGSRNVVSLYSYYYSCGRGQQRSFGIRGSDKYCTHARRPRVVVRLKKGVARCAQP